MLGKIKPTSLKKCTSYEGFVMRKGYVSVGLVASAFLLGALYGTDNQAALKAPCFVPRIAQEFETIKVQLAKCEKDDSHEFCEDAEDYSPTLNETEATKAWSCLTKDGLAQEFSTSPELAATAYKDWQLHSRIPYQSAHVNRFSDEDALQAIYVLNFGNKAAAPYGRYEKFGKIPAGAVLAKYSMVLSGEGGVVELAPVYSMRKLAGGESPETQGWVYGMHLPAAIRNGERAGDFDFTQKDCAGCHMEYGKATDSMLFMPAEVRVQ